MSAKGNTEKYSFANGANVDFVEALYDDYRRDPESVDPSWKRFFEGYEFAAQGATSRASAGPVDSDEAKVEALINAYRRLGHLNAHLDPLAPKPAIRDDMKPEAHGLAKVEGKRIFHPSNLGLNKDAASFDEIVEFLQQTYCGTIGADYRETNNIEAVVWFQEKMEGCRNRPDFDKNMKLRVLTKLIQAEGMEKFLQDRFLGQKRFSIEGLESMIPMLDVIASESSAAGVEEIDIGMAHRGRLNVLANFMNKPYEAVLHEFEGAEFNPMNIEGDVKYHKGFASEIETGSGQKIRLYLAPNPSHLEAVNPVLQGFCRSRQRMSQDVERRRFLPVAIHGDAAFVGQGVVTETLNFEKLEHYTTGGTIHIIANNQIGFTADPKESKSCDYASDMAKALRAPVIHVNADDPIAVIWSAQLAVAYRQKFQRDFVIDLVGYRRHGHNETDEPGFTQPLMYKMIKNHETVLTKYGKQLVAESILSEEELQAKKKEFRAHLQGKLTEVRTTGYKGKPPVPEALKESMKYVTSDREDIEREIDTSVSESKLKEIGEAILKFPNDFTPHPKIKKLFEARSKMIAGEGDLDWGMAELLAYGSIAAQGTHVRLSGQDCGRGTFSHRHAVLKDFETNASYGILTDIDSNQGAVDIINSPLSEAGCLGFEYGYSVADPSALVLWEAQFGDFVNGAQIIIDQFIVASEAKWKQATGLVMLLPHGYEGQGPEHSSARPERFLQSCGNLNIQVANLTTPAQLFHALRRQVVREFNKPLILMTPKSLLRHPKVVSGFKDLSEGSFQEVFDDLEIKDPTTVKRVVICTGKIYYDLIALRDQPEVDKNIPIIRVEQLYPYPMNKLDKILSRYRNATEIVWTQEEPFNMGAWSYMRPRLELIIKDKEIVYLGRRGAGTTAEGSLKSHKVEQERIVTEALGASSSKIET